jgi:predicted Zn-dependent protease with MMP-like domain
MDPRAFERLVIAAYETIPETFRRRLGNVALCVEDACAEDPDLLGLFEGYSELERPFDDTGVLPAKISLFRLTIEEEAEDTDGDVARVIRETLIHEVAHHFGYEEDEIGKIFESRWQ